MGKSGGLRSRVQGGVVRVSEKDSCATADQKSYEGHGRFSPGKFSRYLERERSQSSSRMNCMMLSPGSGGYSEASVCFRIASRG
jgi:hypothetical protein